MIGRLAQNKPRESINFDGHPLTSAMKDSLGGNSKTLVIFNICPSEVDLTQTRETLEFAKMTGKIQNMPGNLQKMQLKMD